MAHYLDTSVLVKLVIAQPGTAALREWLAAQPQPLVSCDLARTELLWVVRDVAPDRAVMARLVLDSLVRTEVTADIFEAAGRLHDAEMRSRDAIHLAAALDLSDDLDGIVTYNERLARGARRSADRCRRRSSRRAPRARGSEVVDRLGYGSVPTSASRAGLGPTG